MKVYKPGDVVTFTNRDGSPEQIVATEPSGRLPCKGCLGHGAANPELCARLPRCNIDPTHIIWKAAVC